MAKDPRLGVHGDLLTKVGKVLAAMEALGFPMRICQGVRTVAEQKALYAQGRTAPGSVVTNCDGVLRPSNHQARADGFGHAVDCCFTQGDPFGEGQPWSVYGAAAKAVGLKWGGDFKTITDRPHVEIP